MRSLPAIRMEMPCFWTGVGVTYLALLMLLLRRGANPASSNAWMGLGAFSPPPLSPYLSIFRGVENCFL